MAADYNIISTQPYTYLDETGQVVEGFRVYYNMTEFDETHFVLVPSLAPAMVQKNIEAQVKDRKDISTQ
jgi:hypothetical protein